MKLITIKVRRWFLFFVTVGGSMGWFAVPCVNAQTNPRSADRHDAAPLRQFNDSVKTLIRQVSPSVVQVMVSGYAPVTNASGTNTSLTLSRQESIGSGFIIDPDGYVITNAHVVRGARQIRVNLPGAAIDESPIRSINRERGTTVEATVVGADEAIDLALLKINTKGLPALPLSNYDRLRQGDLVFAFGSPEGLQNSVTMGVVSATARQPDPDNVMVYVQSDAPINRGNSGGPLVNVDGEVVGINTYILSASGGNEGLGFAIPSSTVAFTFAQLRKNGYVHRGMTGLAVQAITPALAAGLRLTRDTGVIVSDVIPGSPADLAGIKVGDILLTIDGVPADNLPVVGTRLFFRAGGELIKLSVSRGADRYSFVVSVVEPPHDLDQLTTLIDPVNGSIQELGIIAVELDARMREILTGLRDATGVIVAAKAANAEVDVPLNSGDVIHSINGAKVKTLAGLRTELGKLATRVPVVLQIERDGKLMFLTFRLDGNN